MQEYPACFPKPLCYKTKGSSRAPWWRNDDLRRSQDQGHLKTNFSSLELSGTHRESTTQMWNKAASKSGCAFPHWVVCQERWAFGQRNNRHFILSVHCILPEAYLMTGMALTSWWRGGLSWGSRWGHQRRLRDCCFGVSVFFNLYFIRDCSFCLVILRVLRRRKRARKTIRVILWKVQATVLERYRWLSLTSY